MAYFYTTGLKRKSYIIRDRQRQLKGIRLWVVLRCHKHGVQYNTNNDEQVKHRLWDDSKADLLNPQPCNHQTSTAAVETTLAVTIHQLTFFTVDSFSSSIFNYKIYKHMYKYKTKFNTWTCNYVLGFSYLFVAFHVHTQVFVVFVSVSIKSVLIMGSFFTKITQFISQEKGRQLRNVHQIKIVSLKWSYGNICALSPLNSLINKLVNWLKTNLKLKTKLQWQQETLFLVSRILNQKDNQPPPIPFWVEKGAVWHSKK